MGAGSSKSKTQIPKTTTVSRPTIAPSSNPASIRSYKNTEQSETTKTRVINEVDKVFSGDALKIHNEYRALHGAPALVLSPELSMHAQNSAEELAEKEMLMHSKCRLADGRTIGENIYRGSSVDGTSKIKAREPVDSWYNEIQFYDFENRLSSVKSSQFTQVVWKETTHFGIAQATSSDGGIYVVANYSPVGNTSGKFLVNVNPPPGFKMEEEKEEQREIKQEINNGVIDSNSYNDYECLDDIPEESDSCYEFDTVYAREVTNIII